MPALTKWRRKVAATRGHDISCSYKGQGPSRFLAAVHREQRWLGGRLIGNPFELRVMLPQRLRNFHFFAFENANELERVHHRLALEMIVGYNERVARMSSDFLNARDPRLEFPCRVKIVVAFVGRNGFVVAEPR